MSAVRLPWDFMFDSLVEVSLVEVYDAMIDWPKRLAHEAPFYRRLVEELAARRVLEMACGTGRHAAMFHRWGLKVEASDISPAMIDHARRTFGEPEGLRWRVEAFDEPPVSDEPFDIAVCVGNSLALAADLAVVGRAIRRMMAAVRPGGAVVIQVLNLYRLSEGPCIWQKCRRASISGDVLILKGVHRCGSWGYVDIAVVDVSGKLLAAESTPWLGLNVSEVERLAREAGARSVVFYGGYDERPFDRDESVDLIVRLGR